MTEIPKFSQPYTDIISNWSDDEQVSRLNNNIPKEEYRLVKHLRPEQGTMSFTINHLWKKLCDELRKRQITDYSRVRDFEDFVTRSVLVLPEELTIGTDTRGSVPETNVGNDRRRTPSVRAGDKTKKKRTD